MLTRSQQGAYRPLVKAAWIAHCRLMSTAPNNQLAYEIWYREQLWAACRIRSTRDAGTNELRTLLDRFTMLTGARLDTEISGWTPGQNKCFGELVARAWQRCVQSDRSVGNSFQAWFEHQLEACSLYGRQATDRKESFDRAMAHFAIIANDDYWISRTSDSAERRLRYLISECLSDLSDLSDQSYSWSYVRSIYSQMGLPLEIDEAPAAMLSKVYQALDVHRRRLQRQVARSKKQEVSDQVPF